jgi:hypothetical protein
MVGSHTVVRCINQLTNVLQLFKKAKAKGFTDSDVSAVYKAANL